MSWKIVNTATKWINKNLDFSDLLKSRLVLYLFFFISIVNLYTLATSGNGIYAVIFILTSFLTTFFSKNMIVVLCIGLVISNILRQGIEIRVIPDGASIKEGLTTEEGMKESISTLEESDELLIKEDSKKVDTAKDEKSTEKKEVKSDSDEVKPADEDALKEKQQEYKKLLELQNELIKGVSTMTPLLKEAKETFDKIKGMQ
jgi:hypothetical protein